MTRKILTGSNQSTCSPLLGTLLNHFEQILPIMIIADQMCAIDDENQWGCTVASSVERDLLQFVEGSLNVQQWSGIPWTTNAEKTANIAVKMR